MAGKYPSLGPQRGETCGYNALVRLCEGKLHLTSKVSAVLNRDIIRIVWNLGRTATALDDHASPTIVLGTLDFSVAASASE